MALVLAVLTVIVRIIAVVLLLSIVAVGAYIALVIVPADVRAIAAREDRVIAENERKRRERQ